DGRPIAGEERCGVDARAIGAHRERARSVAEERQDLDRARGVVRIEDPYVGATDAWRGELGIARAVLASMSRRDEDEVSLDARDHDVARLIADERGRLHEGARGVAHVDDRDAVREVVDHPELVLVSCGNRDGLETDDDLAHASKPAISIDLED